MKLTSPLQYVKGVGPKKAEALAAMGMNTVRDLLDYYPRHYLDRTNVVAINTLQIDQMATIVGEVKAHGVLHGRGKRYEVILGDASGHIALLWFGGIRYWERLFKKGQVFAATGRVSYFQGMQIVHPDLERLDQDSDQMVHAGRIIPVYPQTSDLNKVGLSSKGLRSVTTYIYDHLSETIVDHLPAKVIAKHSLIDLDTAIRKTHYPDSREQIETCRRRLAFDELLRLQNLVFQHKGYKEATTKQHRYQAPDDVFKGFVADLPFALTSAQQKVTDEIIADLGRDKPMSRLMHGDVGCGKTVVAVLAALHAVRNNLQCAFMAPTEILAEQHYRNWGERLGRVGVKVALLTASIPAARRRRIGEQCAAGEVDLVFGTHALIYDYVSFERLGLVIIDEQHRFGVDQRGRLYAKGADPDLLAMTATPIPRTLALTLYGDLDISTIDVLPPGRQPVRTVWRTSDVRDKVFGYIRDEVRKGGQAYVIYPLIEKSEQMELQNVEDAFAQHSAGLLKDIRVAMVHGRVKAKERDDILDRFRDGEIDALLATTVIEVGIDNPNATLLVIEHAERFGLAQLHQLRGRVGRGKKKSTVVALAQTPISEMARQRLDYFASTTDGFAVAEADLQLRGPGEIFGARQSGLPELRVADLWRDRDYLEATRDLLEKLFARVDTLDSGGKRLYSYLQQSMRNHYVNLGGG
ncbi:MAG: ATP-dependent DNA helicase RecG [candidate division Zixibacteria bacterium]|nr:ATP-dependent DNA helicase RecG [candidate division Zixibacteria bacterium]